MRILKQLAIIGNTLFILWILFNGIDSGFSGTAPEKASFVGLLVLLSTNILLLVQKNKQ